jgi:hypothetical protein
VSHEGPQTWGQACLQATAQVLLWHHAQRERARAVVPQDEGAGGRQRQTNATGYTYTLHGPSLPPTFRVFHELFYDARACAYGMTAHLLRRAPARGCGLSLRRVSMHPQAKRGASMHPQAKSSPCDLVPVSAFPRAQERRSTTPDLQTGALALGAGTRSRSRGGCLDDCTGDQHGWVCSTVRWANTRQHALGLDLTPLETNVPCAR